jgi:ribonuclease HI
MTAMGFLLAESYCNGVQHLRVMGDSRLAIEFMNGNFQVRQPSLFPFLECNQHIAKYFQLIKFIKIKREDNKEADRLANEAFLRGPGGGVGRWGR